MTEGAQEFCTQCGEPLWAGVRFCEQCGSPVEEDASFSTTSSPESRGDSAVAPSVPEPSVLEPSVLEPPVPEPLRTASVPVSLGASSASPWGGERLIGQMPCAWRTGEKGLFGGAKTRQGHLVISDQRFLFIHETDQSNGEELWEDERIRDKAEETGLPVRELVRGYDWFSGPGMRFVKSSPDELLSENPKNWILPLSRVARAQVYLSEDGGPDHVLLEVSGETPRGFIAFRASGEAALNWLNHALGPERVIQSHLELMKS